MFSEKFSRFIEIWQKEFAIERSMNEKICVDAKGNPLPWYTYPAIEYLTQFDYTQKKIFEYGGGSSSFFWVERAQSVFTVEDKRDWYEKYARCHSGLEVRLCEDEDTYVRAIEETGVFFDVIAIDGKYRAACAKAAVSRLAAGGMIILDDSDRVNTSMEYQQAVGVLKKADLLQVDFYGFCPLNNFTKTTTLFLRRDFDFSSKYPVQPVNGIGNLWSMRRKQRKLFFKAQK